MTVTVSIQDWLAEELAKGGRSITQQLVVDLALHYYRLGLISLGKAVELSGLRRPEFEYLVAEYRIDRPGSVEHLESDLDWAKKGD